LLQLFLQKFGYLAIIIGTFFEGETIVILGGIAASSNFLDLRLVTLCSFVGTLFGDQLWFFIGRYKGKKILDSKPKWKNKVARAEKLIAKNATFVILIFRFLYGLRNVIPFILGTSDVKTSKFVILNILSACIWAILMSWGGYVLGHSMEYFMEEVKNIQIAIVTVIAVLIFLFWFIPFLSRKIFK